MGTLLRVHPIVPWCLVLQGIFSNETTHERFFGMWIEDDVVLRFFSTPKTRIFPVTWKFKQETLFGHHLSPTRFWITKTLRCPLEVRINGFELDYNKLQYTDRSNKLEPTGNGWKRLIRSLPKFSSRTFPRHGLLGKNRHNEILLQGGPLPVISGVISPVTQL